MANEIVWPDQQPELSVQKNVEPFWSQFKISNNKRVDWLLSQKQTYWLVIVKIFCDQWLCQLNYNFDHMVGLVNGFCDQKSERSELNRPIDE